MRFAGPEAKVPELPYGVRLDGFEAARRLSCLYWIDYYEDYC